MERERKIRIWRGIAFVGFLLCLLFGTRVISQAQNPVSILDKAASAYENSNGITASFELNTRSDVQKVSESFEGTINMKGDKFTLVTPDMITWFDGTTQWTYAVSYTHLESGLPILLNLPGEHWNRKKVYTILNGWIVQLPWQENMD